MEVGERGWYIVGHRPPLRFLAILCEVVEVENRTDTGEPWLVRLDEPIGHAVFADELIPTREEAEEALADERAYFEAGSNEVDPQAPPMTLGEYRAGVLAFIRSTGNPGPFPVYRDKQEGVEWFSG